MCLIVDWKDQVVHQNINCRGSDDVTTLPFGSLQTHIGTSMPSVGGYIIKAGSRSRGSHFLGFVHKSYHEVLVYFWKTQTLSFV